MVSFVTNPSQTGETSTFTYAITDPSQNSVEGANTGITFTATVGSFRSISVTADKRTINQ